MLKNMIALSCGCDLQTQYECGGMIKGQCEYCHYVPTPVISVALCESRHEIPAAVNGSIFPQEIADPMDFQGLYNYCDDVLSGYGLKQVNIYVTGCTPALIAVINWCRINGVICDLYHYDRETGNYKRQPTA